MRHARKIVPALVLSAAALTAVPASAFVGTGSDIQTGSGGRSSVANATVQQGSSLASGSRMVSYACTAVSSGDVVSTALTRCALLVNGVTVANTPIALPGVAAASGGASVAVRSGSSVLACATAVTTFLNTAQLRSNYCSAPMRVVAPVAGAVSE